MNIATIREIKDNENRVALAPANARILVQHGHIVLVQEHAGDGAGFSDEEYRAAGAKLLPDALSIVREADILVKIKEPLPSEYPLLDTMKGKVLFTYLHLAAAEKALTESLMRNNIVA